MGALWFLERLGTDVSKVVSRFSTTGEARVELEAHRPNGSPLRIIRRFDGKMHLTVQVGQRTTTGASADAELFETLWPEARVAAEPWEALSRALTRAIYLQQDSIRDFVESDSEQTRFGAVGEIIGAGRVTELQRQLESSRNRWTRATTSLARELEPLQVRRSSIAQRLHQLSSRVDEEEDAQRIWQGWQREARKLLGTDLDGDGSAPAQILDRALVLLSAQQQAEERRHFALEQLLAHVGRPPPEVPDLTALESAVQADTAAFHDASRSLATAQAAASSKRRRQVEAREDGERRSALAQLALQQLSQACPVCGQPHDREATERRLRTFLTEWSQGPSPTQDEDVVATAAAVEVAERALAETRSALRNAGQLERARTSWEQTLEQLVAEAGLSMTENLAAAAEALRAQVENAVEALSELRRRGERVGLQLARSAELAQRVELERELAMLDQNAMDQEADLQARGETAELAGDVLSALREASESIVVAELDRIEPLLQRIYATVDPHPALRVVHFLTRTFRGKGRLWTTLHDQGSGVSVEEPAIVLSSSQLNVLAVSTFLALNLAIDSLPLRLVALDDPLQSLDTVNLLGLADLLRRVKQTRQVIVSTHDERLAALLTRKLRPVSNGSRTRLIKLSDWTREGPTVEDADVPPDVTPLRLAASA